MDRTVLLGTLSRVQGACAAKAQVPAFGAVFFDGSHVTTYDGELAVVSPCNFEIEGGVELKPLMVWLSACSGDRVTAKVQGTTAHFQCSRSRIKLPLLDSDQLAFEEPRAAGIWIAEDGSLLPAFHNIAPFMGNDPAHPGLMGVTVAGDDHVDFYATDNMSLMLHEVSVEAGEGQIAAVLPPRFVKILCKMEGELESIEFGTSWATASFLADHDEEGYADRTVVYTRLGEEVEIDRYVGMFESSVGDLESEDATEITEDVQHAIKTVAGVMQIVDQVYCQLVVKDGELTISSGGERARARQSLDFDHENVEVWCAAQELLRLLDGGVRIRVTDSAVVVWGQDFLSLLATAV